MNVEYLRDNPETVDRLIEHQRIRITPLAHGPVCTTMRLTLDNGTDLFAKTRDNAPHNFFSVEADGLRYLSVAGAPPIPEVIAATPQHLVLEWIPHGDPTPDAAAAFGRALAQLHKTPAQHFGATGIREQGFVGSIPLDNRPLPTWPEFFIERRCRPYLASAYDTGVITHDEKNTIEKALIHAESALDTAEPPVRIHGDLWSGNIMYSTDNTGYLIDAAAASGGNRELDLANLTLFETVYFSELLQAYREVHPLIDGWQERIAVHKLHLLLVHCVVFGRSYVSRTLEAASTQL